MKNTLLIFLKYPEPGLVKTRLAKGIGKKNAACVYKIFVESIIKRTTDNKYHRMIFYSPSNRKKDIEKWLGRDIELYPQRGKDLGERLVSAFRYVFKKGAKKIVAIGTDSPLLHNKIIIRSFEALERNDAVIGPSIDGGYYLIGLARSYKNIFKGIDWGTDRVFNQTLQKIRKQNLKFKMMEEYFDVDDIEDLLLLYERMPSALPR